MKKVGQHPNIIKVHDCLTNMKVTSHVNKEKFQMRNAVVMDLGVFDLFAMV